MIRLLSYENAMGERLRVPHALSIIRMAPDQPMYELHYVTSDGDRCVMPGPWTAIGVLRQLDWLQRAYRYVSYEARLV